jgi:NADPH2:quinone reductase
MRAWLLDDFNGTGSLRLGDYPDPLPKMGEAVLKVQYAGLNPADHYVALRQYPAKPPMPHILGRDGIGTVVAVGAGASHITVGDRKIVLRGDVGVEKPGTFADLVAVPIENLVDIPAGWSDTEAAGATLVYLTAYQALTMWGELGARAVVLVTGASGGVGVASIQLARAMGFDVVALSRSEAKRARLVELGAKHCFDPTDPQWGQSLKRALGQRRVDLAIDNVAGTLLPEVIATLDYGGRVSLVGRLAGPVPEFNTGTLFFRRLRIGGVAASTYTNAGARAAWQTIVALLVKTNAKPIVDSVLPFEQLPKAFERLIAGPMGKVLIAT